MVARNEKGQFCKGESGNPGGRPVAELSITALIDAAVSAEDWDFIIKQLLKQARRGNLKAAEMLMDRRFGKPVQVNENNNSGGLKVEVEYVNSPFAAAGDAPGAGKD